MKVISCPTSDSGQFSGYLFTILKDVQSPWPTMPPSTKSLVQSTAQKACQTRVPSVFCWTKMGTEAGQQLADIIRRKELERASGGGIFAWGIGNSVGPAIRYARSTESVQDLETLFTPMKAAPKSIDVAPTSIVMWLGFVSEQGETELLPPHMLVTSRGQSELGLQKRSHYALICKSSSSLVSQRNDEAIDHRAVRNLVSSNPVGASQVTSVVRYSYSESSGASYPVLFRAKLTGQAFVRLAMPVLLTGSSLAKYREVCAAQTREEWTAGMMELRGSYAPGVAS